MFRNFAILNLLRGGFVCFIFLAGSDVYPHSKHSGVDIVTQLWFCMSVLNALTL